MKAKANKELNAEMSVYGVKYYTKSEIVDEGKSILSHGKPKIIGSLPFSYVPKAASLYSYIRWGKTDAMPMEVVTAIEGSPVGKSAIELIKRYIVGDGFVDEELNNIPITRASETTFYELLRDLAECVAHFNGAAIRVEYPTNRPVRDVYDFIDLQVIPFTQLRAISPGYWAWHPYFNRVEYDGTIVGVKEWSKHMTTAELRAELARQKTIANEHTNNRPFGLLFTNFTGTPLLPQYPNMKWYAGLETLKADARFEAALLKDISASGMPRMVMTYIGSDAAESVSTNSQEAPVNKLRKQIKEACSVDTDINVILNVVPSQEQKPQIDVLNVNEGAKDVEAMRKVVTEQVCITMEVPQTLLGIAQAGQLGDIQEIKNRSREFEANRKLDQALIEKTLMQLYERDNTAGVSFAIKPRATFDQNTPEALAVMTDVEKRQALGLPKLPVNKASELSERLSILPEQLKERAMQLITDDEIRKALNLPKLPVFEEPQTVEGGQENGV